MREAMRPSNIIELCVSVEQEAMLGKKDMQSCDSAASSQEFILYRDNPPYPTTTYAQRNEILLTIGFKDYASYLASNLWRGIRKRVRSQAGIACRLCGKYAHYIHHLTYEQEVLEGKNINKLSPLCGKCHDKVEFGKGKTKRSVRDAHTQYLRLLREFHAKNISHHGSHLPTVIPGKPRKERTRRPQRIKVARKPVSYRQMPPYLDPIDSDEFLLISLNRLGYSSWDAYGASPLYQEIAFYITKNRTAECSLCPSPATTVQFLSTNRGVLRGNQPKRVVPICACCKLKVNVHSDGTQRRFRDAYHEYRRLLQAYLRK